MPKLYMMVGVPGSGKSNWIAHQEWADKCAYISTDKHVEAYAASVGFTYDKVFHDIMPKCVALMTTDVIRARIRGLDIIWDQTSVTIASRKKKFKMLPEYDATAVVIRTPPTDILMQRLASRPGKTIPWEVVSSMINQWEEPTLDEGFKEILIVQ